MRVDIFSDIHGNLPALGAVLDDAIGHGVETFWCLGDVVGYGPWPIQCWSALRTLGLAKNAWVAGNHDLGLVEGLYGGHYFNGQYFNEAAKTVLDLHRELCRMSYPEIFEQIKELPTIAEPQPGVILAHGSPKPEDPTWTVTKYTTSKTDAEQALADLGRAGLNPHLIVVGHSHYPLFWRRMTLADNSEPVWREEEPQGETPLGDLQQQTIYLNPGSLGQPRDGSEASYCYLDWETMTVCFRRTPYPRLQTKQKMLELGYPEKLICQWY